MIKPKRFKVVGRTTNGELVVTGMLEFLERFGLPAEIFCLECKDKNFIPDWFHFCLAARKANWSQRRIIGCVSEGAMVWGREWANKVIERCSSKLNELIKNGETKSN